MALSTRLKKQIKEALCGQVYANELISAIENPIATVITSEPITGFVSGAGSVTASDTILTAFNKIDGNVALKAALTSISNINNTSDANKPVSTAQAAADAVVLAAISTEVENAQTDSYTLVAGDKGKRVTLSNAGSKNLTIDDSLAVGSVVNLLQIGAGQYTVIASGVTIHATPGLKFRAQYSCATLWKQAAGVYYLTGDLSA